MKTEVKYTDFKPLSMLLVIRFVIRLVIALKITLYRNHLTNQISLKGA